MSRSPRRLVLIGPPHVGKTTVGKQVSRALRVGFTDTDREIAKAHGPIPALFEQLGEPGFRELERIEVERALTGPTAVVSLGGGAPVQPAIEELLESRQDDTRVVLLDVRPEVMRGRLIHTAQRPLLAEGFPAWERLYGQRVATYRRLADLTVDTSGLGMRAVADRIVQWCRDEAWQEREHA